ncbi:MAG: tRNA 2-thiouridine(34) synthase MnmA [Clostridiales bacterium]|nr:tRNA 2-thiouridine(34) synthase MnmA [Clostridiales bacterium]
MNKQNCSLKTSNFLCNKKAVIAMSGGVDSSVAAYLVKSQGYDCIGATMKFFHNEDVCIAREKSCCSLEDVEDARNVANSLGIPYYVFNFTDRFREDVIDRFVNAYETGATPNPCIDCNRYLKFEKLFLRAKELNYDYVVTGHYARIEFNEATGRYLLKKAIDETKDQSYVLYSMTQEQLAHTLFPLGHLRKTEVRKIAEENSFVNAKKHDSQDICFVQNGTYTDFIRQYTKKQYPSGNFVLKNGTVLGEHKGIINYTVGQRKGLGIPYSEPLYVSEINVNDNTVVLGTDGDLYSKVLTANNINLISVSTIEKPTRVKAKIRYRQAEQPATVMQTDDDLITVEFDEPQRAVTK